MPLIRTRARSDYFPGVRAYRTREATYQRAPRGPVPRPLPPLPAEVMEGAACASDADPEWWFGDGDEAAAAKAICATCPVLDLCRRWSDEARPQFGIWGGCAPKERGIRHRHTYADA
jgi:WhiB family redox-sensing transcriptional regulator